MIGTVRSWVVAAIAFGRSWFDRFLSVQGLDRAMALSAQAFSALIPLIIVYSALAPRKQGDDFASELIDRFNLTGSAAATVHAAFTSPSTVQSSINVLSVLFVIIAALSFSRGMQRLYEGAYRHPTLGMRNTGRGLIWLLTIVVYLSLRPLLADIFSGTLLKIVVSLALGAALWTATPYLLLGGRLDWHDLVPGAFLTAIGMSAVSVTSVIWFPRSITASADQFGSMGVAFALLSWLFAAACVLVATATGGAVINEQLEARRAKRAART
jgi:membrane protein